MRRGEVSGLRGFVYTESTSDRHERGRPVRTKKRNLRTSARATMVAVASFVVAVDVLAADPARSVNLADVRDWTIYVAADAIPSERYAAEEFRDFFAEASGARLRIVTAAQRSDRHVYIGDSALMRQSRAGFSTVGLGPEDLRIVVRDDSIAIAGGRPRGTLYGVYTFLEDYLGVRFLTPDCTHVPALGEWRKIDPVDRIYRPPLAFRYSYYGEVNGNEAFAARLRINTVPRHARFGGVTSRRLINHSFASQIPSRRYGKEHPEYYSLVDGKRLAQVHNDSRDNEPCLTNPKVLEIVTAAVLQQIEREPEWSNISVSQNDNDEYCRCAPCAAIDAREGSPMGSLLTFVNAVAAAVKRDHPGIKVGTLAYWYTRKPPLDLRPADNVQIQLASIECSQLQPIDHPDSKLNAAFRDDLRGWGRISDDICIWSYMTNFHNYLLPCPNLHTIEPNIRFFVANSARGVFMQGAGNAVGAEFSGVRNYMASRLLWNPNLRGDELLDEFVRLYYGKAAPAIRQFIALMHENALAGGFEKSCFAHPADYGIDRETAARGLEACRRAFELAEDDDIRARVERASIWAYRAAVGDLPMRLSGGHRARWNRGGLEIDSVLSVEDAERARPYLRRLLELCRRHGVTRWSENWSIEEALPVLRQFLRAEESEF